MLIARITLIAQPSCGSRHLKAQSPPGTRSSMSGNKAGYESSTRNPNGSLQAHFEFNDRGRGPKSMKRFVAGKDGIPTEY